MAVTLDNASKSAEADATCARCNGGTIDIRTASGGGGTLLATLTFGNPAFGAASNGVATANAITAGTAAASGTAAFARLKTSGGATVLDCTVSASGGGGDMIIDSTTVTSGTQVSCSSLTYTRS